MKKKKKKKPTNICNKNEFEEIIKKKLIDELNKHKFKLEIDLQNFNNDCYEINCLLSDFNYFLRVFELKNKFRQIIIKGPKKKKLCWAIIELHK